PRDQRDQPPPHLELPEPEILEHRRHHQSSELARLPIPSERKILQHQREQREHQPVHDRRREEEQKRSPVHQPQRPPERQDDESRGLHQRTQVLEQHVVRQREKTDPPVSSAPHHHTFLL